MRGKQKDQLSCPQRGLDMAPMFRENSVPLEASPPALRQRQLRLGAQSGTGISCTCNKPAQHKCLFFLPLWHVAGEPGGTCQSFKCSIFKPFLSMIAFLQMSWPNQDITQIVPSLGVCVLLIGLRASYFPDNVWCSHASCSMCHINAFWTGARVGLWLAGCFRRRVRSSCLSRSAVWGSNPRMSRSCLCAYILLSTLFFKLSLHFSFLTPVYIFCLKLVYFIVPCHALDLVFLLNIFGYKISA